MLIISVEYSSVCEHAYIEYIIILQCQSYTTQLPIDGHFHDDIPHTDAKVCPECFYFPLSVAPALQASLKSASILPHVCVSEYVSPTLGNIEEMGANKQQPWKLEITPANVPHTERVQFDHGDI